MQQDRTALSYEKHGRLDECKLVIAPPNSDLPITWSRWTETPGKTANGGDCTGDPVLKAITGPRQYHSPHFADQQWAYSSLAYH